MKPQKPLKSKALLNTLDERGRRVWVYPADVRGRWKRMRTFVHAVLVVILLALPWIRMNGHQAFHLDIPGRHFTIFGTVFFAHDAPLVVFLIAGGALTLGLVTAVFGRAWCGWACPQTVFIEGVVRRLERWIEGDAIARRQRDLGPWTVDKAARKSLKWVLLSVVVLLITHSVLAFFVGTDHLGDMVSQAPWENPVPFLVVMAVSGLMIFDLGYFREQFCTLICPYGRFQSVLMDGRSLAVAYDEKRGEPRRGVGAGTGDCVDCGRCVAVCPTGIDVRIGFQQLECIACTACADACDEIMDKIKKPRGLIRYASLAELEGGSQKRRVRPWVYAAVLVLIASVVSYAVLHRVPYRVTLLRPTGGQPYELLTENGQEFVVNRYKVDLLNRTGNAVMVSLTLDEGAGQQASGQVISPLLPADLRAGDQKDVAFFVKVPRALFQSGHRHQKFVFEFKSSDGSVMYLNQEAELVGPF